MKLLASLLEAEESKRQQAFKLQQELIDLLPDDFDVSVTQHFLHASDYEHGKVAVKVKHPSYKGVIANEQVLVFPLWRTVKLSYTYKSEYGRVISYFSSSSGVKELATDLEKNIQTNSV